MMRRHGIWMVSASILVLVALSALPAWAQTGSCQLAPVFVMMRDLLGKDRVGECTGSQGRNEFGDITQVTTRGILTLRQADQVPMFSDGQTTWLYGPNGIENRPNNARLAWETTTNGATPTPTPFATATPTPATYGQPSSNYGQSPLANPPGQMGTTGQPGATWPQNSTVPPAPGSWPSNTTAPPSAPAPNGLPAATGGPPPASGQQPASAPPPLPVASPTVLVPTDLPISLDGDDSSTSDPVNLAGGNYAVRWEARLLSGKSACYVGSRLRRADDQNPGSLIAHTTLGSTKDRTVSGESRLFSVAPGRYVVDIATTGCAWKLVIQAP